MKIAVLVKQVIGAESALQISQDQKWIDENNATFIMNPPDNYAIEEAMLIKEKLGVGEVVVVSMGPQRVQKVIREGLSKGADRGIHIEEESQIEIAPLIIAQRFADVLKEENCDLILTGLQSDDTGMGQTGILIGEILGLPTATLVVETNVMNQDIKIKRELESGWFLCVQLPLPASISIQSGLNTPRYPSLKGIMGAKKKEIKTVSTSELTNRTKNQLMENIYVPKASKKTEVIDGPVDKTVERIVEILKSEIKVV